MPWQLSVVLGSLKFGEVRSVSRQEGAFIIVATAASICGVAVGFEARLTM